MNSRQIVCDPVHDEGWGLADEREVAEWQQLVETCRWALPR
jgi:hypothetical protein